MHALELANPVLFLSTLSLRRATQWRRSVKLFRQFLSTLSLRRATVSTNNHVGVRQNFYPRSPCGERLYLVRCQRPSSGISIHALLAESDEHAYQLVLWVLRFLSTLSLRRATKLVKANTRKHFISIHALLAESDSRTKTILAKIGDFYPRSPCGERRITTITICTASKFLSTLSLRRATCAANCQHRSHQISIHALLAESDSTNPKNRKRRSISIHALLAESDRLPTALRTPHHRFLSTLSLRRATGVPRHDYLY